MVPDIYSVKLDIFEGPMDLLVYLIRKNEVDVYDIPISMITDQYLSYIDLMKKFNLNYTGDFIQLAATLAQIKSRMLLPRHNEDEDEEDPRLEIARPLIEYLEMKSAAEELLKREILGQDTFIRHRDKDEISFDQEDEVIQIGIYELINAFDQILTNIAREHKVDMATEKKSVKERIIEIVGILEKNGSMAFHELFEEVPVKGDIILTFLATLEMAKLNLINIIQHVQSGIIRLFYI